MSPGQVEASCAGMFIGRGGHSTYSILASGLRTPPYELIAKLWRCLLAMASGSIAKLQMRMRELESQK
jgi:hypothetical protein